ncbi:hypothetical protein FKP32DRAFT_235996 [Trametes sanguinea]|nr:hypothetical protein FKP32DRAFT_235996 [Trametes sanguinea]
MPYNEDAQPNEVRHTRKGNAQVPAIRSSHSFAGTRYSRYDPMRGASFSLGHGRSAFASSSNSIALGRSKWVAHSRAEASGSRQGEREQAPWRSMNHRGAVWRGGQRNQQRRNAEQSSVETIVSSNLAVKDECVDAPPTIPLEHPQIHSSEGDSIKWEDMHQPVVLEEDVTPSPPPLAEPDNSKQTSPTIPSSTRLSALQTQTTHVRTSSARRARGPVSGVVGPRPDQPKENGLDGVCWGRWEVLSKPPRFRSGTFMLSLPSQSMTFGRNGARQELSPESQDVDAYSRIASPAFEDDISAASPPASSRAVPRRPLVATLASEEAEDSSIDELDEPVHRVHLRKDPHDKPRRLLPHRGLGILSISMRGCIDLVEEKQSSRSMQVHRQKLFDRLSTTRALFVVPMMLSLYSDTHGIISSYRSYMFKADEHAM